MNLDAGWFFPWVERRRHGSNVRSGIGLAVAALARWNGIPVRAGLRVSEERADRLVQLRPDDVFEFPSLQLRLGAFNGKRVFEEPPDHPPPPHPPPFSLTPPHHSFP